MCSLVVIVLFEGNRGEAHILHSLLSVSISVSGMDSEDQDMIDASDPVEGDQIVNGDVEKDELDDLFGATSSEEEAEEGNSVQEEELVGKVSRMEGDEQDGKESKLEAESENKGDEQQQHPLTSFTIPKITAPTELGYECVLVKVPAFLRAQLQEPFDPASAVDQEIGTFGMDPDNIDAHTATRVLTTIRYRTNLTSDNKPIIESNTRLIEWEDGSMSVAIGEELFEVIAQNISEEHNYIFQRHAGAGCMEVLGRLERKLLIRPYITDTGEHRRFLAINPEKIDAMTGEKLASGREPARVRIAEMSADPEGEKAQQIRLQQEKIRARRQQESRRRNLTTRHRARPLSADYLEADSEEADMDKYEEDFIDDTGLFEDEAGSESMESGSAELEDSEDEVYGKSRKRRQSKKVSKRK